MAKVIYSHDALDLCIFTSDKESVLEPAGPQGPQGIEQLAQRLQELAETVTEVITSQSRLIKMNRNSIDLLTEMGEVLQSRTESLKARTDILLGFCAPPGFVEEDDEGGVLAQRLDQVTELVMAIGISVARMEGEQGGSVADFFKTQGLPDPDDLN